MEGANHCYETEMTSNYRLAANVRVCQLLHRRPLFPSSPLCLFVVVVARNRSGRSQMQAFLFKKKMLKQKRLQLSNKAVSHREQQLPAVSNQWSFLQINSIQLSSTAHCRFLDVGFWKLDRSLRNTESLMIPLFWIRTLDPSFHEVGWQWFPRSLESRIRQNKKSTFLSNATLVPARFDCANAFKKTRSRMHRNTWRRRWNV